MNRLRAGFCRVFNPYNSTAQKVPLTKEAVEGIVFWTKNIGPMMRYLPDVRSMGFPFVVQHTITGYPRTLETSVTDATNAVAFVREIAQRFGTRCVVWRYDPILVSDLTPVEWHLSNFATLAKELSGATDEVVVSFAHFYQKTRRNLEEAARKNQFTWLDPTPAQKRELLARCVEVAASNGIQLALCAQPDSIVPGAKEAHCVDAQRLSDLKGTLIRGRVHGNRPGCACAEARDVGEYDTCPHGCVYCYAVRNRDLARRRYRQHDPEGEFLFRPAVIRDEPADPHSQPKLF